MATIFMKAVCLVVPLSFSLRSGREPTPVESLGVKRVLVAASDVRVKDG